MVYVYVFIAISLLATVVLIGWLFGVHDRRKKQTPTEELVATLMARLNESEKARRSLILKLKKTERENERLCEEKLHAWDIPDKV